MFNPTNRLTLFSALIGTFFAFGCATSNNEVTDSCIGIVDTAASDQIVVHNSEVSLWQPEDRWEIVEEMRYGSGDDSLFFGSIISFDVDRYGNLFVLDGQTQKASVLDSSGALIRTVGNQGTGPGEFEEASAVDVSENGEILIMEMRKGQLTIFNVEGNYRDMIRVNSVGWMYVPYPGGFDQVQRYNALIQCYDGVEYQEMFARFDQSLVPIDTMIVPSNPEDADYFEYTTPEGGSIAAAIPYQGAFDWLFGVNGNLWTLSITSTNSYELKEITSGGTVVRIATRELSPIPVTSAERAQVREDLSWFTNQGGTIDLDRVPSYKPVVTSFFSDDTGNLWIERAAVSVDQTDSLFDVFNADGKLLGEVQAPFSLRMNPAPIVKDQLLYGITTDADGGSVIVRAKVTKPL